MLATLEHPQPIALQAPPDHEVVVRLTKDGTTRIRATQWDVATWLRRRLHERGWICTSPSPLGEWRDYCFFVTKGPATVRRNLLNELQSMPGLQFRLEAF
jgi:hypothetical protein